MLVIMCSNREETLKGNKILAKYVKHEELMCDSLVGTEMRCSEALGSNILFSLLGSLHTNTLLLKPFGPDERSS